MSTRRRCPRRAAGPVGLVGALVEDVDLVARRLADGVRILAPDEDAAVGVGAHPHVDGHLEGQVGLAGDERLLRRICKNCKEPHVYPDDVMEAAKFPIEWAKKVTFYRGKGCDQCNGTGYKGRAGVYEVMMMTPGLRKCIMQNLGAPELRDAAIDEGMLTLREDALSKLKAGLTTPEEVVRVTRAI